jgi:replication-associated recombination protein RarA
MIPNTRGGLPAMAVLSLLQKAIRRGQERQAMEAACELMSTSKPLFSMVCKRLQVVSHEDVDTIAQPHIVPFVKASVEQAQQWYDPIKIGASCMAIGNAIRRMCRAAKSREGDHFSIAVGLRSELEGYTPVVPDFASDMHTLKGKQMKRGLDHFRHEGAKLVPAPEKPDIYENEADEMLALRQKLKQQKARDLFDDE